MKFQIVSCIVCNRLSLSSGCLLQDQFAVEGKLSGNITLLKETQLGIPVVSTVVDIFEKKGRQTHRLCVAYLVKVTTWGQVSSPKIKLVARCIDREHVNQSHPSTKPQDVWQGRKFLIIQTDIQAHPYQSFVTGGGDL